MVCSRLLVVAVSLVWLARAQAATDESATETAKARFAHGVALAEEGDYQGALQSFSDAYAASPHVAVLYNIGQAQVALGRPLEAVSTLSRYLREGGDSVPAERRRQVESQLELLRSFLVDLDFDPTPEGVTITVDGNPIGRTPLSQPVRIAAGTHTIAATIAETTQPAASDAARPAEPPPDAPTPAVALAQPKPAPAPPIRLRAALPYVLLGSGVGLGTAALVIYLCKRGDYQRWQDGDKALNGETPGSDRYRAQAAENQRMAASLTTANHTMLGLSIAGGALVAAGASLYVFDWVSARRSASVSVAWAGGASLAARWRYTW